MEGKSFCIISYNSRGFNDCKRDFIRNLTLISGCTTYIFNQENFLLKSNAYMARNTLPDHHLIIKPAVKNGLDGRPKNGMFIAVPASQKEATKEISVSSDRLQCVVVDVKSCKLLLVNSYFPTDPGTDFDENELLLLLAEIKKTIDENTFDHVVFGGDINADFKRSTKFVSIVKEFLGEIELKHSWELFRADFTHTHEREGRTFTSLIDHLFWNERFSAFVEDAGVLHLPENMSDHCPVFCKVKIETELSVNNSLDSPKPKRYVPSWQNVNDEEKERYVRMLEDKLSHMDLCIPCLSCRDVHCDAETHMRSLDAFMIDLLEMIEESADNTLMKDSRPTSKRKENLPNWKEDIDPSKDTAHFWNAVWKSAGKPLNCHLHNIMKRTRNQYHYTIRKKKKLLEKLKRDKMLKSCLNNDANIFKEIRKQRSCKQDFSSTIDGKSEDIPEYLACKYEKLYNQVDDKANLMKLELDLKSGISSESLKFVDRITGDVVKKAVHQKLKPGKKDPVANINSDLLIHAPPNLFKILSKCFKSYMIHGHVSKFLLISSLVPLIKDKLGDVTDSNNYRSIAISSLIMKIFDLVIIAVFSEFLQLDDLQFSYQSDVSTSMCTWVAVETISYFLRNGNEVYTCLMDMSKAFDTVQHSQLFRKLLEQGMPAIVVRYVLVSYKYQKANVRWNGKESRFFDIGNGVKQGAILSAILYCVYTNGIFQQMRKNKIGCFMGGSYAGILGYADDLYLMSPTLDGLQKMLNVCETYAETHNLRFSTNENPAKSKTKCMAYLHKDRELRELILCGNKLPWVDKGKHLGMRIDAKKDNLLTKDIIEKRARYIQSCNELVQEFSYTCSRTKAYINRVFNSHAYGSVLWNLHGNEANMLYNTWSTSIRRIFQLDRRTHRYLIEPISKMEHLKCAIQKRFISFTEKLKSSPKIVVRTVNHIIGKDCRSITGENTRRIMLNCGADPVIGPTREDISKKGFEAVPTGEEWRAHMINELIDMRDGLMDNIDWEPKEVEDTLTYLCTT